MGRSRPSKLTALFASSVLWKQRRGTTLLLRTRLGTPLFQPGLEVTIVEQVRQSDVEWAKTVLRARPEKKKEKKKKKKENRKKKCEQAGRECDATD